MLCVGAAGLWAGPWRSSRPRWMWPLTKRWRLNSPTRSCWNANTASTRYKSTPNPCSRSKTSRWVSAAAQRNTKLRLEVCSRVKCWRCRSQVDVYIKEKEGINLLQVKGSLSSSGLERHHHQNTCEQRGTASDDANLNRNEVNTFHKSSIVINHYNDNDRKCVCNLERRGKCVYNVGNTVCTVYCTSFLSHIYSKT